jgi:peptidoglycan glycosyltransferase
MNKQIGRLFGLLLVLFGVLIVATSWWTVFGAKGLTDNSANRRPLLEEQRIPRGKILARDGTELAISQRHGKGNSLRYVRQYPTGPLFAHAVGYSFITQGRSGLERKYNDPLTGNANEFKSILEQLTNKTRQGEDLHTTLDPQAQRTAIQALGGQKGAVVALEPDTGRVRVMASVPSFDPNLVPTQLPRLNRDTQNTPLVNRATQSQYPPGSTFKVVTAAAAIDSGKYNPDSIVDGHSPRVISGTPLSNFGGENFGPISLTDALTNSVNTVWAQVGESLGRRTLEKYMDRFGFNRRPPIDYPSSQLTASGVYSGGRVVGAEQQFDVGRVAIGEGGAEGQILVTPLQMAMVAAAVGNKGELMRPRLADKIVDKDGRVKESFDPEKVNRVISEKSAGELAQMMANVVKEGTGTASALQGIQVAGKTGTAQVAGNTANQAWFIAFAPVDNPKMAIAVTVERTQGTGGEVAAPIAKQVLQSLIGG